VSNLTHHSPSQSTAAETQKIVARVLCLGNELLADDSLGCIVADQIRDFASPEVDVISTPESGFHLLDYVLNIRRLVVVDTVVTGISPLGAVCVFQEDELKAVPGGSPHYVGLYETLAIARRLGLPVAEEVFFIVVEAADCFTLGGGVHPAVLAAVPALVNLVREMLRVENDGRPVPPRPRAASRPERP